MKTDTVIQILKIMEMEEEEPNGAEALNTAIGFLTKVRWIPVSKRMPDKNGTYLVTVKQGYITFGIWIGIAENWTQVIAWMPLPEPYKAESEE